MNKAWISRIVLIAAVCVLGGCWAVNEVADDSVQVKNPLKTQRVRFRGVVVDEEGHPIRSARVSTDGSGYKPGFFGGSFRVHRETKTNKDGRFAITITCHSANLYVYADGYYSKHFKFSRGSSSLPPLPEDELRIVLLRVGKTVDMYSPRLAIRTSLDISQDSKGKGVRFDRKLGERGPSWVDNEEEADIWFEWERDTEKPSVYTFKIIMAEPLGIRPALIKASPGGKIGDEMCVAPELGYVSELKYKITDIPPREKYF